MTFGADHYIPILKVKRGEKAALTLVAKPLQKRITPLLEIVQRTDKHLNEHLETAFKGLSNAVQPYPRCFLDARELEPDGTAGARSVFWRAREEGIVFTPVTGVSRSVDVKPAKEFSTNGLALRLTIADYESGRLRQMTEAFLSREDLSPPNIDLFTRSDINNRPHLRWNCPSFQRNSGRRAFPAKVANPYALSLLLPQEHGRRGKKFIRVGPA